MTAKAKQDIERIAPANVDAERTILGSILLECSCPEEIEHMGQWLATKVLDADDFFLDSHRKIFQAMGELIEDGSAVDIITVAERLDAKKELADVGGRGYLCHLTEGLPHRLHLKSYVRIVKAKSLQRQLITVCTLAVERAYEGVSGFEVITQLTESLKEIEDTAKRGI